MSAAARMDTSTHDLAASFDRAERFVALALDQVSLIVAQQEIQALEPVLDAEPISSFDESGLAPAAGTLALPSGPCPVFALDSDLRALSEIPAQHRICAIMNHRDRMYAVSCKEVRLLTRGTVEFHAVPRPLESRSLNSPIKTLVVNGQSLLLGTSARALFAHIVRNRGAQVIDFDERARRPRA